MNNFQKHNHDNNTWIWNVPSLRPLNKYCHNTATSTLSNLISINTTKHTCLIHVNIMAWSIHANKFTSVHIESFKINWNTILSYSQTLNYNIQQNKKHGISFLWSRDLIHHILPSGLQWSTSCRGQ